MIDRADKYRFALILRKIELIIVEPERSFGIFEINIPHPCEHNIFPVRSVLHDFEVDIAENTVLFGSHRTEFEGDPSAVPDHKGRADDRLYPTELFRRSVHPDIIPSVVVGRPVRFPIGIKVAERTRHSRPTAAVRLIIKSAVGHTVCGGIHDGNAIYI